MVEPVPLLMVDDLPENLSTLEAILEGPDLALFRAQGGNEALRLTLHHDFALVLLDVQMPDINGFEVAELLRLNPKTRHIPIIFITAGIRDVQFQFKGYQLGAVDYLIKPIEPLILLNKIRVFCDLYCQRKEIENFGHRMESLVEARTASLLASQNLLLEVGRMANVGGWELDLATQQLTWTEQLYCIHEVDQNFQPTVQTAIDFYVPQSRKVIQQAVEQAVTSGKAFDLELQIQTAKGRLRWVHAIGRAREENGTVTAVAGTFQDITERKQFEQALQEGKAFNETLFQTIPFAVDIVNMRGEVLFINERMQLAVGAPVQGQRCWELYSDNRKQCEGCPLHEPMRLGHTALLECTGILGGKTYDIYHTGLIYQGQQAVMEVFVDVTERKYAEGRIRSLAYYDQLTQLPNRTLVHDRFDQAIAFADRSSSKVGLAFIDLDKFKTINDSLGHAIGDGLIREAARRMEACVRDTDTVSRQGGDEFLCVLSALGDADAVAPILGKLMGRLSEPYRIDGHELNTSAFIGIALYPTDGQDFESLLKKADMAMYRAKEAGRNTWRFFDEKMNSDADELLQMHNGLRRAIERAELFLHYQPQVDLLSGQLIGVEALLRWQHPELGLVPPARFIPVAEDSGLIVPIGEWVLREACRQTMVWRKAGVQNLVVAVNLSAVQFKRDDIEQTIIAALRDSGLDPALLELELTESILINDTERVLGTVRRLKALGVQLSIDDFGTGYSSLSYLRRFHVDKLKIDQSFVRNLVSNPEDAAIVRAIIQMAHNLGLTTIAEGVENMEVLARLRELGCRQAQGYHFSRPMPSEHLLTYYTQVRS